MDKSSSWAKFAKANGFRLDLPSSKLQRAVEVAQIVEGLPAEQRLAWLEILRAPPAIRNAALTLMQAALDTHRTSSS